MTEALPDRFRRDERERVLITPEGVALGMTIASPGARAAALIIDLVIVGSLILATGIMLASIAGGALVGGAMAKDSTPLDQLLQLLMILWVAAMFLFRNAYFIFFELGARGATPGKRLAGIRVAARDANGSGGRLSAEMVIARNLLRDIELFLPVVFLAQAADTENWSASGTAAALWFLIFALFPLFNKDRLRAGDIIAGTWVVETPRRRLERAMSVAPEIARSYATGGYRFGEAELAVYGEYELQMLERVLRDNRTEAMQAVYETICAKIGWTAGHGDARPFLEAYYRALRQRLETGMRMGKRKADKHA
jgi:uncharacterized RDD family membrane protein YckC